MAEKHRKGAGRPKSNIKVVHVKGVNEEEYTPQEVIKHINGILTGEYDKKLMKCYGKLAESDLAYHDAINAFYEVSPKLAMKYLHPNGYDKILKEKIPFSSLTDNQLLALLPILNKNCFVEALSVYELQEVFEGKRTAKVRNIGVLAYILRRLAERDLICGDWQHQAEANKMFVSVNGIVITAKKFSNYRGDFEAKVNKATLFPKDKRCTNVLPIYEEIEDFFASI